MSERVDKLLHQQGIFESRKKAQVAIEKGLVFLIRSGNESLIKKVSEQIEWREGDSWRIVSDSEFDYVSRAGAKLAFALEHFKIDVKGKICLDIGLSTGGFSDCLLKKGVRWVLGVDVGTEQLHPKMKTESQLIAFDKVNAREPLSEEIMARFQARTGAQKFDLIVIDVSFISLLKVLAPHRSLLATQGEILVLFKPQFEVGPAMIHKKGLAAHDEGLRVLEKTVKTIEDLAFQVMGRVESSLKGEDGNQEYFIYARATDGPVS